MISFRLEIIFEQFWPYLDQCERWSKFAWFVRWFHFKLSGFRNLLHYIAVVVHQTFWFGRFSCRDSAEPNRQCQKPNSSAEPWHQCRIFTEPFGISFAFFSRAHARKATQNALFLMCLKKWVTSVLCSTFNSWFRRGF